MAHEKCPFANEGCPYWNRLPPPALRKTQTEGCFSDIDHVIPQRLGRLATSTQEEIDYIHSKENQIQTCRWEHENKPEDDEALLLVLKSIIKFRLKKSA